ncbi:LysR family transcriptional regulator [Microbulbifer marinus]|uniref:DNA-binding transcriptional regulator, LysR family n=1 Tax=Microbulbifer marinus TaxID=658218 RepID=A0A1H3VKY3_9GAMM|nr:LysR family transcriptional regulator [Microbulbifer marinus]SDZ75399.1 DNA-binding transcriptional regulator, LysR family [Microbulbifer marinus]
MEIEDLEKFLVIAATENLQRAADRLDTTAGGLSKSLRRLETALDTRLFDRVGKQIRVNDAGRRLQRRAAEIVAMAQQTRAEFGGLARTLECRVAAPAMLQLQWARRIQQVLAQQHENARLSMTSAYESLALKMLVRGEADFALVTDAMTAQIPSGMSVRAIGSTTMRVAAAPSHPLVAGRKERPVEVTTTTILQYPFAAPTVSPFCGEERGIGSDGWREDALPRRIGAVVNDYGVLCSMVMDGELLAYLPEQLLGEIGAVRIKVVDCPYHCTENLIVVWRGGRESWLDRLVPAI